MSESSHVGLWNRCLEIIRDNVPESTYKTWFVPIVPLKYEDKTLIVQVPSQFFYEFLEDKFVDLLRKTLYKVIQRAGGQKFRGNREPGVYYPLYGYSPIRTSPC